MKINQVFNDFILVLEHPHTLQTQSLHYSANQWSPIPLYTSFFFTVASPSNTLNLVIAIGTSNSTIKPSKLHYPHYSDNPNTLLVS